MATTKTKSTEQEEEIKTLQDLYVEQLQDLYSAETQIIAALPKMIAATTNADLKKGFQSHLEETKEQANRLEQILTRLGEEVGGKTCKAMAGLVAEGAELLEEKVEPHVLDAGLIAAAQRIEHYEMAGYGTARTFATQLGDTESIPLLEQTLREEKLADQKLTVIAESKVNQTAANQ